MSRRVIVGAWSSCSLAALAVVAVGRWERTGTRTVRTTASSASTHAVGDLDGPTLEGFRFLEEFQCLV